MPKFKVEVHRHYTYEIDVEANDEFDAQENARDWEIEDLEPHETDAYFTYEVVGYPKEEN